MKTNIYSLAAVGVLMVAASCSDDHWEPTTTKNGKVALSELAVDVKENANVVVSTAGRAGADVSDFTVTVYDKTGASVGEWKHADMPEILTLPADEGYTVKVESHKQEKFAWEKPYYHGVSRQFAVAANQITEVGTVVAEFSALKVTMEFSDELMALLGDDTQIVVEANDEGLATYTHKETRAGYFAVVEGSTTMAAHFKGSIAGQYTEHSVAFTDIKKGEHRIVRFGAKIGPEPPAASGSLNPGGITLTTEIVEVDVDGNVTVKDPVINSDDREGQEESEKPVDPVDPIDPTPGTDAATFSKDESCTNFTMDGLNVISEDADFGPVIVIIDCPKGIQNLNVTIASDSQEFLGTLADEAVNIPTNFDLAHPGDAGAKLGGLGLPVGDAVLGKTADVRFNITDFMPLLAGFPGNHNFSLEVVDAEGNKSNLQLNFKAQ